MDVQTISVVIAAVSVVIGVINSILSSRRSEKNDQQMLETRQAQLFMQIYNRWNTRDIQTAYGYVRFMMLPQWDGDYTKWMEKFSIREQSLENLEPWLNAQLFMSFMEGLGMIVKKGLINIELVDDLLAGRVKAFWDHGAAIAEAARASLKDPKLYDSFEYLYNQIKQREQATVNV